MRSRLHKKMQLFVNQELPLLIEKGYTTEFRNSSVSDFSNCRENIGAGSGTFALSPSFSSSQEAEEKRISNPRVLSDMGLAIRKHTCLAVSNNTSSNNQ
jgi:hypothetical protein